VSSEPGRTFLVESYVAGLDEPTAAALASRLRDAIRQLDAEGTTLRWRGSFALVEETSICIIDAPKVDDVVRLSEQTGLEHDHVVEALALA
jgi:hypothetical protein